MAPGSAFVILLLLSVAFAAECSTWSTDASFSLASFAAAGSDDGLQAQYVGDVVGDEEMEMESEISRRALYAANRQRYISYGALSRNRVPCSNRGRSYYNCRPRGRANPYRRGCSVITRCARTLK